MTSGESSTRLLRVGALLQKGLQVSVSVSDHRVRDLVSEFTVGLKLLLVEELVGSGLSGGVSRGSSREALETHVWLTTGRSGESEGHLVSEWHERAERMETKP